MVKDTDATGQRKPRAWHGGLLLVVLGLVGTANACGGRTVWVEEDPNAGASGDAGTGGRGGAYSGGYGGDYGDDDGYSGGYGGVTYGGNSYGGVSYGGVSYGGVSYGGSYGGYGGVSKGGYGGVGANTGGIPTGGVYVTGGSFPTGGTGIGGSVAGSAGVAGKGGCGAASGAGGSAGSTGLLQACASFCPRYPYASCASDFEGPRDCLAKCQQRFGLDPWCEYALVDFLACAGSYLNPNAMCIQSDGQCYGPGCVVDAVNACAFQYASLLQCQDNPRPIPPCPPPPNRPVPPGCGLGASEGSGFCSRETLCPMENFLTECYPSPEGIWYCECYRNGVYEVTVGVASTTDVCYAGAGLCGYY